MRPRLLNYWAYRHQDFVTEELDSPRDKKARALSFSGLSPFDVPEQVTLEVFPDYSCTIHFRYADSEKGESSPRQLASDPGISVLLGRHTGKILAIQLRDALARITQARYNVDLRTLLEWPLPEPALELRNMNADLVGAITKKALSDLRPDLIQAWSTRPIGNTQAGSQH